MDYKNPDEDYLLASDTLITRLNKKAFHEDTPDDNKEEKLLLVVQRLNS